MEKQARNVTHFFLTKEIQQQREPSMPLHLHSVKDTDGNDKSYITFNNQRGQTLVVSMEEHTKSYLEKQKKRIQQRRNWKTERWINGTYHVYAATKSKKTEEDNAI